MAVAVSARMSSVKETEWKKKRIAWAGFVAVVVSCISFFSCLLKLFVAASSEQIVYRNPEGLFYGISGVVIAQVITIIYQYKRRLSLDETGLKDKSGESKVWTSQLNDTELTRIQLRLPAYGKSFWDDVEAHLKRPELLLLLPYLSVTWIFNLMPESYYNVEGRVKILDVILQLLTVDFFTYCFHLAEHNIPKWYILGHKAHHKYTNPHLFNAFDATVMDTIFLILFPLFSTAQLCHVNCWSYVAFGMVYSTHFMLIHSEFEHHFDPLLKTFYVNTAADHHVHHKAFKYNYGHFFTIFDKLAGTYRAPESLKGMSMYQRNNKYHQTAPLNS